MPTDTSVLTYHDEILDVDEGIVIRARRPIRRRSVRLDEDGWLLRQFKVFNNTFNGAVERG